MNKYLNAIFTLLLLLGTTNGYAMGKKKLQVEQLKGVTESQVNSELGKDGATAAVMLRGKAAELVYRMMKEKKSEKPESEALKLTIAKGATHTYVKGRQISCSKISNPKRKQDDYACSFNLKHDGSVWAGEEAFNPAAFNLSRTETGSKLFKKNRSRGLASAVPSASYSKGQAFLVFDEAGKRHKSENTLIVFRGESAQKIMGLLETNTANRSATWNGSTGKKGEDIACVSATAKEPERCAIVVSFRDGAVTKNGNPLFQ